MTERLHKTLTSGHAQQIEDVCGRLVRLPTEEEWEYACRCGRRGAWSFGDDPEQLDQHACTQSNSDHEIHSVRGLLCNAWNLFDMHGNSAEWCLAPDAVAPDYLGIGPLRGGGFASVADETLSSTRLRARLSEPALGTFRLLMEASYSSSASE